jgi:hypothetical protein
MTFRRTAPSALVIAASLLFISAGRMGYAQGTEWSPGRFEHRSFSYIVAFDFQLTPKQTSQWRTELEMFLHKSGFVPPHVADVDDWEFMRGSAPGVRGWIGEARIINPILKDETWVDWSVRNPELAKTLWPEFVARAQARQFNRLYVAFVLYGEELRTAKIAEEIRAVLRKSDENTPD